MIIRVFTCEGCTKCEKLKSYLQSKKLPYTEIDMNTAEGKTELAFLGIFCLELPVLQLDNNYFEPKTIFNGKEISDNLKFLLRA